MLTVICILFSLTISASTFEVIDYVSPENCNQSTYFNSLSHQCLGCGPLRTASGDHLTCQCESGYHQEFNYRSKTFECIKCEEETTFTNGSDFCRRENLTCGTYDIKGISSIVNKQVHTIVPFWSSF